MAKKLKLPDSGLGSEEWPLSPSEDLSLYLEVQRQIFEADKSSALPAFFALIFIVADIWKNKDASEDAGVTVPMWIVETIAEGFLRYREAAESGTGTNFGEAYGIEGGGQGKEPRILTELRNLRDIRIATRIAQGKEEGGKIEAILQELHEETGLSLAQVRRIWEKHRQHALTSLRNLRTRKSS